MIDAAVIGGGPAGLAAALRLKARGAGRVVIFEREAALGGSLLFCQRRFFGLRRFGRLLTGPAYAALLASAAQAAGVESLPGHAVTALHPQGRLEVLAPHGQETFTARRVLLATGLRETPPPLGAGLEGVLNSSGLRAALAGQAPLPFSQPVVAGTHMASLSALALCRRHGIRPAAMVEARPRSAVGWPFSLYPRLLRVKLVFNASIERIDGTARPERVQLSNGASLACDGVLFTGAFLPEASLVRASHLSFDAATGGPAVDQYGRCSDVAYFAAGALAAIAMPGERAGEAAGDFIADDLSGGLPSLEGRLEVRAGPGLQSVVPQCLAHVAPLRGRLELRAAEAAKGQLRVRAGEAVLYRRRVEVLAAQRIVIDLDGVRTPPDDAQLIVEIVA